MGGVSDSLGKGVKKGEVRPGGMVKGCRVRENERLNAGRRERGNKGLLGSRGGIRGIGEDERK